MPASHEDVGHRPLPSDLEERRLDRRPILVLVELDAAHLLCAELGEECLDLVVRVRVRVRVRVGVRVGVGVGGRVRVRVRVRVWVRVRL